MYQYDKHKSLELSMLQLEHEEKMTFKLQLYCRSPCEAHSVSSEYCYYYNKVTVYLAQLKWKYSDRACHGATTLL